MFLRCSTRKKNGKEHHYWSIVENRRVADGRVLQRHVLYLGEISGGQQEAWQKSIEIFEDGQPHPKTVALLPEQEFGVAAEATAPAPDAPSVIRIRLAEMELRRPRQWGACWLAGHLYAQLGLDRFFAERLPPSRKGTRWTLDSKFPILVNSFSRMDTHNSLSGERAQEFIHAFVHFVVGLFERAFLGEGLVVELAGGFGIKTEVELVFPAELEAGWQCESHHRWLACVTKRRRNQVYGIRREQWMRLR